MNLIRKFGSAFLWLNKMAWSMLPDAFHSSRPGLAWGRFILFLVNLKNEHTQLTTTYFFRNRAELKQLNQIVSNMSGQLKILVVGCSEGAEVHTIIYTASKAQPDLKISVEAFDIDKSAIETARNGRYPENSRLFKYIHDNEISELFSHEGEWMVVRPTSQDKVHWNLADPTREPLLSSIPKQDILFINRLLFHMSIDDAERCLCSAASLVRPGGFLFVSGVNLDLRTRIAKSYGWLPVTDHIDDIHAGDETMTMDWPFERWGLEPLDKSREDWSLRYCSVFRIP